MAEVFKLKQFDVAHGKSTMKVGTDAMLLGAWIPLVNKSHVLEVGCGCGIISLMLAQRNQEINITAIDIDNLSVEESSNNFGCSPWSKRLHLEKISFKELVSTGQQFDLIVANPPYFQNSLKSPNDRRNLARHQLELEPKSFFQFVGICSHKGSEIGLIFPSNDFEIWKEEAVLNGFYPNKICKVHSSTEKQGKLMLSLWNKNQSSSEITKLTIKDQGEYTGEYRELMKDFLTIF